MTRRPFWRAATVALAPPFALLDLSRHSPLAVATGVVVAVWLAALGAVALRVLHEVKRPGRAGAAAWQHADLLTTTGVSMMWTSALAFALAQLTGWASFSVVGLLGLGTVCATMIWTALVAAGERPWRDAVITRAVLPEIAVEGDPLREEIQLAGVWIPSGMRLFAVGHTTPHGATSRYALGGEASRAELKLESALGPAARGTHRVPPLSLWLGDVLGITRTPAVRRGEASFVVLPRTPGVRGADKLLGANGDDAPRQLASQQPSEGTFRIRGYAAGDDTRRIHWVRSLQVNGLVVRLPDEVPHATDDVRLILDNELRVSLLTCRAPHELLDALVRVWLGAATALAETGRRVSVVAAAEHAGKLVAVERPLIARSPTEALRLGARVGWQAELPLTALVAERPGSHIIVSSRPRELPTATRLSWIVVPDAAWTSREPVPPQRSLIELPFPLGAADNRGARLRDHQRRVEAMVQDRALFSQVTCWTDLDRWSGHLVAQPCIGGVELAVIP